VLESTPRPARRCGQLLDVWVQIRLRHQVIEIPPITPSCDSATRLHRWSAPLLEPAPVHPAGAMLGGQPFYRAKAEWLSWACLQCFPVEFQQEPRRCSIQLLGVVISRAGIAGSASAEPTLAPPVAEALGQRSAAAGGPTSMKKPPGPAPPQGNADGRNPDGPQRLAWVWSPTWQTVFLQGLRPLGCSGHRRSCWGTFCGIVVSDRFSAYTICHWATPGLCCAPILISPLSPNAQAPAVDRSGAAKLAAAAVWQCGTAGGRRDRLPQLPKETAGNPTGHLRPPRCSRW